jgi:hypothetical protein
MNAKEEKNSPLPTNEKPIMKWKRRKSKKALKSEKE